MEIQKFDDLLGKVMKEKWFRALKEEAEAEERKLEIEQRKNERFN